MGINVCHKTALYLSGIDSVLAVVLIPGLLCAMVYTTRLAFGGDNDQIKHRARDDSYINALTDRLLIQTVTITVVLPFLAFVTCLSSNALTFCYMGARGEMAEYPSDLKHMVWVLVPGYTIWAVAVYAWAQTLNEALGGNQRTWTRWKGQVYFMLFPAAPLVEYIHGLAHEVAQRIVLRGAERANANHSRSSERIKGAGE